jgi:hypothetical protein
MYGAILLFVTYYVIALPVGIALIFCTPLKTAGKSLPHGRYYLSIDELPGHNISNGYFEDYTIFTRYCEQNMTTVRGVKQSNPDTWKVVFASKTVRGPLRGPDRFKKQLDGT